MRLACMLENVSLSNDTYSVSPVTSDGVVKGTRALVGLDVGG